MLYYDISTNILLNFKSLKLLYREKYKLNSIEKKILTINLFFFNYHLEVKTYMPSNNVV